MGTIAEKLKRRLRKTRARRQPTSLSKLRHLVRHVENEIGPANTPHRFPDYHPNHAIYLAAQNGGPAEIRVEPKLLARIHPSGLR